MPPKPAKRGSLAPWMHDWIEYYQHQVDGVRELARRRSFILADDMGLGKSLEALTVFAVDVVRGWAETMIVIAPPTLKGNWADEIEKFTSFPYVVLDGSPADRVRQLFGYMTLKGPKILIIGYEQAYLDREQIQSFLFDVAVYDEAHYIKNPMAQRTKAVLEIRSRRSFMLTGTPLENRVDELWCLLHRVDPEQYSSFYRFRNRYVVFGGYANRQVVGVKNEKELIARVNTVMLRRLKKDVLDLPDVQYLERRVDLYEEQRKFYDEINDELLIRWHDLPEPEEIEWSFTKVIRLRQVCGTLLKFSGKDVSAKLDLAIEDDKQLLDLDEKIVVFTQFRDVQECYLKRVTDIGVPVFSISGETPAMQRPEVAKRWSKVNGPAIFCAMQQVAYAGLTLTAAKHASFLDSHYNPQKNQQAVDRLHRIGADLEQPVQVRKYICRKTVETRIEAINNAKRKLFNEIVNSGDGWKKKLVEMLLKEDDDD